MSFPWLQSPPRSRKGKINGLAAAVVCATVVTCLLVVLSPSQLYGLRHSLFAIVHSLAASQRPCALRTWTATCGAAGGTCENSTTSEGKIQEEHQVSLLSSMTLALQGETIKAGETTEVYILSAFRKKNYQTQNSPSSQTTTVVLVAWATNRKGIDSQNFVCCLAASLDFTHSVVQAPAVPTFAIPYSKLELGMYVDMYRASFACQLPSNLHGISRDQEVTGDVTSRHSPQVLRPLGGDATVNYVAFAQRSCDVNMTDSAHRLEQPNQGRGQVAVCVGFVFGKFRLERLVEWLELARVLGVSRVQIFHSGLGKPALHVLRHYNSTGFVLLRPVTIPHRPGQPQRDFTKNEPQKWQDKDVLLEDCRHRLEDHDFVIHQDLDELLIPSPPFTSLLTMLQAAVEQNPQVAAFQVNTFLSLSHWPVTDPARPITFLRRLDRTVSNTLDNRGWGKSSPKVIYRPSRVGQVTTHDVFHVRPGSTVMKLPDSSYRFIHYRSCKPQLWGTCHMERKRDESLLRFESQWLAALARLPLVQLGLSEQYASAILRAAGGNSTSVGGSAETDDT